MRDNFGETDYTVDTEVVFFKDLIWLVILLIVDDEREKRKEENKYGRTIRF